MENIYTQRAIANEKSSAATILFFFLFGIFGVHRFYLRGVTFFNVLYLFTLGFFFIMVIIDLFLVWGMAKKVNDEAFEEAIQKDMMHRNNISRE